ncbi:MAG TPA: S1-like domain-containing RNA-binding protein [Luteolibacter sp.]|nr:S1-like domain-containing RNA-binding protein [Luteolibacter sp.]
MPQIGQRATLPILRESRFGVYLDAGDLGEILLPRREMPDNWSVGAFVDVFLYHDSEDRPVATLKQPKAVAGQFARLKCLTVTGVGAFLDWGLPKDLLVPFREQKSRMEPGKSYLVHVFVDEESGRLIATTRLTRHLDKTPPPWRGGEKVEVIIYAKTDLGYKAVIEHTHTGLLFANQVFQDLHSGEKLTAYIADRRPDGKIDLALNPPGRQRVDDLSEQILNELKARGGFWPIGDHSSAEEIKEELGVSKRTFKQTLGALLKARKITQDEKGIRLI